ncbi:MAG: rhodanese-like domain-containing protein [Capsulimonadaceae bacterium]|nr:rhodanese-like domain-containing protein [Capsulimonadaceae bacterium]
MAISSIDVRAAHDKLTTGKTVLVDVRAPGEYGSGHAAGAVNVPLGKLERRIGEIPADRPVLVICQSGRRSEIAVATLRSLGRKNVVNVLGGTAAWRQASLPIERTPRSPVMEKIAALFRAKGR